MDSSYSNLGGFGSDGAAPSAPAQASGSFGTGDIILTPEKKSHKGIIIIALAVLIIGGFFAVMFLTRNGDGNVNISNNAKLAFNKYANYLLYGEDSDKPLEGEYDEDSIYKLDEMWGEDAQAVTNYFKIANELLANFESFTNANTNGDFITTVDNYRADFELVRLTFNKEYITEEELVNEVLSNNLEDTKTWIADKYNSLAKSSYESVKKYAEAEINYYQLYAEYLENLKARGCFGDGAVCDSSMDENLDSQMAEYEEVVLNIKNDATRNTLSNCWVIEKMMSEGSEV